MSKKCKSQCAALPYRLVGGQVEVMLVTSRDTGRWILPKGWLEKGIHPRRMAKVEALEEAGVIGKVWRDPISSFTYDKIMPGGTIRCTVSVYPLAVSREVADWKEAGQRERRWFQGAAARCMVSDAGAGEAVALLMDGLA
jgi:8-oxo-dGTP pyrophosphatase MutT (NUDIX family)